MRPFDGQADLLDTLSQRVASPALDAETLGRTVLMLDWFAGSGLLDEDDAARVLADRLVEADAPADQVGEGGAAPTRTLQELDV